MRCPECQWPMGLAREEKGIRVWRCEKCKREKRGVTKGEILMSWKVPVKLQEKAVLVLALLALAEPVRAAPLTAPTGTLISCTSGCTTGCSRDGQTVGVVATAAAPAGTGSCDPASTTFDYFTADGANAVTVLYKNQTANIATFQLENSNDNGTTWFIVPNSSQAVSTGGNAVYEVSVTYPAGRYRVGVACTAGCNETVRYHYVTQR